MDAAEQVRRYRILLQAASRISSVVDLDDLIDQILDRAQAVIQSEACSLLLPDRQTGDLMLFSTGNQIRSLKTAPRVPAGKGVAGEVFLTKQPINLRDARQDSRHYDRIDQELGFVTRALLTIPLLDGDRCLGVMQALNPIGRDHFGQGCLEIFTAFGVLIVSALLRLEAQEQAMERVRARQELSLAREIQESFLPPPRQRFPVCGVFMQSFPARNVGGDFYFLHQIDPNRFLLGLGDVAGKGVPAALTMARATAMIKAMGGQLDRGLADWVRLLNRQICEEISAGRFICLTVLLADAAANRLQIVCAGQFAPVHLSGGTWHTLHPRKQPPLGILPAFPYEAQELDLLPGELWLLYSDGVTEARDPSGHELTEERFLEGLPTDEPGAHCFEAAIAGWRTFVGKAAQHDDASFLLLDWRGPAPPEEFRMTCCPETLCSGRQFIEAWAKHAGYDDTTVGQIVLACDEACSNVFRHGYQTEPGPLALHARIEGNELLIDIRDQAPPVETDQVKGRDLDDLRPGGLGTVILRKTFDSVDYQPSPAGNCVRLRRKLPNG